MRKLLFTLASIGALSANAQNKTTTTVKSYNVEAMKKVVAEIKNYKPITGTITAEFGLTGGLMNTDLALNNNAGLLRFRYFLSNNLAARIGFSVTNKSNTKNFYAPTGLPISGLQGSLVTKNSGITINLGVEKHFKGSDRLSTYVGGDLLVFSSNASEKRENTNTAGTSFQQGFSGNLKGSNASGNASSGFGFRLVTGAEYYIVKNVYLGAELGFGFQSLKSKEITGQNTTSVVNASFVITSTTTTPIDIKSPGKNSSIAPSVVTGIRIGFQF